jgi:hypothetical protein
MKKVLLLGAILLIGTQAMATENGTVDGGKNNGAITNKFTVSGFNSINNNFKDLKDRDGDLDGGSSFDYALMYNATDRFRIGGETGYRQINLSGQTAKDIDDSVEGVRLGLIMEYDFYVNGPMRGYVTGSLGTMFGYTELTFGTEKKKIETNGYSKLGLGLDYNGFLVETGVEAVSFTLTESGTNVKKVDQDGITNTSAYVSLGYKF